MENKIDLIIHGIPSGQQFIGGTQEDNVAVTGYYHPYDYDVQMLVDVRKSGASSMMWYTYIVNGTTDVEGRPGGYLGVSIRMSQFYSDLANIYNLLDATFRKYLVGSIVKKSGKGYQFVKSEFSSFENLRNSAQQEICNYLMQFSVDSDFRPIPNVNAGAQECTVNPQDCGQYDCLQLFSKYGKMLVSPFCVSIKESQIVKENGELSARVAALRNELDQEREKSKTLQDEKAKLSSEIQNLSTSNSRIHTLEQENKECRKKLENVSAAVKGILPTSGIEGGGYRNPSGENSKDSRLPGWIPLGLLALIFLVNVWAIGYVPKKINKVSSQIAKLQSFQNTDAAQQTTAPAVQAEEQGVAESTDTTSMRIDIEGISKDQLKKDKEYKVTLLIDGKVADSSDVKWIPDDCFSFPKNETRISAKKEGSFEIKAKYKGQDVKRTVTVVK